MRISKRQQEEIDFFARDFTPTQEEKEVYILETVHGKKGGKDNIWQGGNRISESKRRFDITIAMWREDLVNGLLSINELYEDEEYAKFPYWKRLIDSVLKSLNFNKYKTGKGFSEISAYNAIKKHEIHHQ